MKKIIVIILGLVFSNLMFGQEEQKKIDTAEIKEPGWELVISGLVVYTPKFEIVDPATEFHLTYWTTHKWAFGVGYSMVFEEEGRIGHELAGLVSHRPWEFLTLNVGPSFSLPNSHKDTEVSAYLESEFAFNLGEFHAGPTVGILAGEFFRIFGGIHISYEF